MYTSLIRIWNFICITFIFYGRSLCQDASLTIVTSANYQQEKLKFGCSPTQLSAWSSLSHVILSKNTSATTQDIVTVILQTNPIIQNKTWFSGAGNWQSRAQIIKQYVQPVMGSGIEFDIPPEQVLCSDEGTYHCKVSGQNIVSQNIEKTASGTLSLLVNPTSINQIQVNPPQVENIYNALTTVTLTCSGTVGRPAGDLTWCYRKPNEISFSDWPFTADIKQEDPIPNLCQNSRTSTLKYNVSAAYEYYEFKCVTGSTSCNNFNGLSTNITIYRYPSPPEIQTTDTATEPMTSGDDNRFVALGVGLSTVLLLFLVVNVVFIFILINARKSSSKDSARSTANTEEFYITPEDQGSSYETLGARDLPNVYSQVQQTR